MSKANNAQAELVGRLRALQTARREFVNRRLAMNAAIPAIDATRAERAVYDERYQADHKAHCELNSEAARFAQWADDADAAAEIERMAGEVERHRRTLTDPQRMLWRDDVEGICPSPDVCWEYGDTARCGPCAIKQAKRLGVDSNLGVPNLPEVYRLNREVEALRAALKRCADIVDRNLHRQNEKVADVCLIAQRALGGGE